MRLIDADALLDKYISNKDKRNNILIAQTDYAQGARDIIEDIIDAPTIWPEQKKGYWIDLGSVYECSVCHERSCCAGNYCPDCGADMKGE